MTAAIVLEYARPQRRFTPISLIRIVCLCVIALAAAHGAMKWYARDAYIGVQRPTTPRDAIATLYFGGFAPAVTFAQRAIFIALSAMTISCLLDRFRRFRIPPATLIALILAWSAVACVSLAPDNQWTVLTCPL